jgi:hypothetical protein
MIDYIQATKHLSDKDRLFLGHCRLEAEYSSGWQKYWLQGCEKLEIWYNPSLNWMRLQGSIMYYWQGHNFTYDKKGFVAAIDHIIKIIHISIWDAMIEAFEYGVIMQVPKKPKEYIKRHSSIPSEKLILNEKPKDKGNFRWWEDRNVCNKMYDAAQNIKKKQGLQRKEILKESGWNPEGEFLKWEAHYLKPEILNHGKGLLLADLMKPYWENVFKEDLYVQYKRLIPMKSLITPTNKKDLSSADIVMLALAEAQINAGENLQEVKKMLYDKINAIPEGVLSKADKDSRKRQIKSLFDKLQESPESEWDLSEKLGKALKAE